MVRVIGVVAGVASLIISSLGAGCSQEQSKVKTRLLGDKTLAGTRLTITARLVHSKRGVHMSGGRLYRGGQGFSLGVALDAQRDGRRVPLHVDPQRVTVQSSVQPDMASGERAQAALKAQLCSKDNRLVWRVVGLAPGKPGPWELVYVQPGYGVRTVPAGVRPGKGTCQQVLAAAPAWQQWRDERASRKKVCQALITEGTHLAAARCLLRDKGHMYKEAYSLGPQLKAAVLQALAPDPRWDAQQWNETAVGLTLGAIERAKVEALMATTAAYCSRTGVRCPAWRLGGMARAARRLGGAACLPLLDLAARSIGRSGIEGARAALLVLRQIHACAPPQRLAPIMRAGLSRPTKPELVLKSPGAIVYTGGSECEDRDLRHTFTRRRGYAMCGSLPRLAGSWLGLHCDAAAVAAGLKAAAAGKPGYDPRTSQVFDGALRLLGWCDAQAFEQAIAGAPATSPTIAVADTRGKKKLRAIFLHPRPASVTPKGK